MLKLRTKIVVPRLQETLGGGATGLTSINDLGGSAQTIAAGSTGDDFNIVSLGATHTLHIPTASATKRGLLASADWTTFNGKIGGSGTANLLAKFTAGSTVGNSSITDDGTTVTTNSPVGIGGAPAASALLHLTSTTKGFLPPAMTTTQRNAITTPATGLMLYNTSDSWLNYYDGSAWQEIVTRALPQVLSSKTLNTPTFSGGSISLDGTTSGYITFSWPATITTHTLTLPAAQGAVDTYLKNNGSGTLSWSTVAGGVAGSGTTDRFPKFSASTTIADSNLYHTSTNLVELKNGAANAQQFRVYKSEQATWTTNGRIALVLGSLNDVGGGSEFGSVIGTYGAGPVRYIFGCYEGAPIVRLWEVDTAGALKPSSIAYTAFDIGADVSYRVGNIYMSGSLSLSGSDNLNNLKRSAVASPEGGIQIGKDADEGAAHFGLRTRDAPSGFGNYTMGSFTLSAGRATGTARPTYIRLRTGAQGTASGSTYHTNVDRVIVGCVATLTSGTANNLFDIALPSGSRSGGHVHYTIESSDGTEHQLSIGEFRFGGYNKAGTITSGASATLIGELNLASSGTIAIAASILDGASKITVRVTPTIGVITPTTLRMTYTIFNDSQSAVTYPAA